MRKGKIGAGIVREGAAIERVSENEVVLFSDDEAREVVFFAELLVLWLCEGANLLEVGGAGNAGGWIFF